MNFVKGLLTNRFGIVLATLNVCVFIYVTQDMVGIRDIETLVVLSLNAPALACARVSIEILRPFIAPFAHYSVENLALFVSFFVLLQWLFIGWLSKRLAEKLNNIS